jgi:hypothetical protein
MKYLGEKRDGDQGNHALPQNVLLNLSQSRSFESLSTLVTPNADLRKCILFSTDINELNKMDPASTLGITGVTELDERLIDYDNCNDEDAKQKLEFATRQYALETAELLEKAPWELVCSRVATKGA